MRSRKIDNTVQHNTGVWRRRVFIGTPMTGLVRAEWAMARWGQIIPTCWAALEHLQWMSTYGPMNYLVADAQNIIVKHAIEQGAEWLLLIEQDNVLPPDAFIRFNQYMIEHKVPVVSGLYFTKSVPAEPLVFRGRGHGYFADWKFGDKVWVDGVPTGTLLIHMSILKVMWNKSEEYKAGDTLTRRVFHEPRGWRYNPEARALEVLTGTSDLDWCTRVMQDGFFKEAGWPQYQKKTYPFLVDTNIFVRHIDDSGRQYPLEIPKLFI